MICESSFTDADITLGLLLLDPSTANGSQQKVQMLPLKNAVCVAPFICEDESYTELGLEEWASSLPIKAVWHC